MLKSLDHPIHQKSTYVYAMYSRCRYTALCKWGIEGLLLSGPRDDFTDRPGLRFVHSSVLSAINTVQVCLSPRLKFHRTGDASRCF
jgi:hypothetical protein